MTRRSFLTTLALLPTVAQIPLQASPQAQGEAIDPRWLEMPTTTIRYSWAGDDDRTQPYYNSAVVYHGWD